MALFWIWGPGQSSDTCHAAIGATYLRQLPRLGRMNVRPSGRVGLAVGCFGEVDLDVTLRNVPPRHCQRALQYFTANVRFEMRGHARLTLAIQMRLV